MAFQVLKAMSFLHSLGLSLQGMLRMESIYFTEQVYQDDFNQLI